MKQRRIALWFLISLIAIILAFFLLRLPRNQQKSLSQSSPPKEFLLENAEVKTLSGKIESLAKDTLVLGNEKEKATLKIASEVKIIQRTYSPELSEKPISFSDLKVSDMVEVKLIEKEKNYEVTQILLFK